MGEYKEYIEGTKIYDVNQDKIHDYQDTEIMYRYLNNLAMHSYDKYNVILDDEHQSEGGGIVIGGEGYGELQGSRSFKVGASIHIAAFPYEGYEFAGWTGDLAGHEEDVVPVTMDREYVVGAKFRKTKDYKVTLKTVGGGKIQVCTGKKQNYRDPEERYGEGTLLVIKPIADDGWVFAGYSGDTQGFTSTASVVVDHDVEITAMFVRDAYNVEFKTDDWKMVKDGKVTVVEGSRLDFGYSNFSINESLAVTTNENIDMTGDYLFRAYLYTGYPLNNGAELVFNYKDSKNYYYFKIGGYGNNVSLGKVYNGYKTTLARYDGKTEVGGIAYDGYPITVAIQRQDGKFSCYGYKNGGRITYFENIRDKTHDGGTVGAAGLNNGILKVSTMVIQKELADPSQAVVYVPEKAEEAATE